MSENQPVINQPTVSNTIPGASVGGNFLDTTDEDLSAIRIQGTTSKKETFYLNLVKLEVSVQIYMSMAYVDLKGTWIASHEVFFYSFILFYFIFVLVCVCVFVLFCFVLCFVLCYFYLFIFCLFCFDHPLGF